VEHYLKRLGLGREQRTVLVHRLEAVRDGPRITHNADNSQESLTIQVPPTPALNYRQIVSESAQASQKKLHQYRTVVEETTRERHRLAQESSVQMISDERRTSKLLQRPNQVKSVADKILESYGISTTPREAYRRPKTNVLESIRPVARSQAI
jgi:hypothetical protein